MKKMPIKKCQIGGVPGFKWGDKGKCYTGRDAKTKAIGQGIAIGGGELDLATEKVSFDYDGTITLARIRERVKKLVSEGVEVFIISARSRKVPMLKLATELGILPSRVYATGSNEGKLDMIEKLEITTHYDNNESLKKLLPEVIRII
jgi:hypothetical protein